MSYTRTNRRRVATGMLVALMFLGTATAAGAHPRVAKWWQYDKATWRRSWNEYPKYRRMDARWEQRHPHADPRENRAENRRMKKRYRRSHFHQAFSLQRGQATWYDADGQTGACGKPLVGKYAASRTLPCGSLVSVRANGHYALVRILDRGPYGSSSRIIDLSPRAFRQLAPLGAGVIDVRVYRLQRR